MRKWESARRHLLGVVGLLFLASWLGLWKWAPPTNTNQIAAASALRIGAVLVALWLALPQLAQIGKHFPPWLIGCLAFCGLVIAVRPRLALYLIPIAVAIGALQFVGWLFKPPKRH